MTPLALRVLPARDRVSGVLRGGTRGRLPTPALIDVAIATLAVLLIASPMLFTSDGFAPDFTNDMWLAGYQQHAIAAHLHPTLFLQTQQNGVFYPLFAFYGGTLFALTGALAALLGGSTILAFEAVTLAAIAAAYGGLFWLARQLGVKGVLAHAPAIVFVTSAYYVTNLYGRGAWAEFMAVSVLPLIFAASLRLVRGRWRAGPVACLVAASVVFSGSHNITLLWGSTLALAALACYWLLSGRSRELPWRRMLAVAGLIALGVALNGWFLLPALSYAHDTNISGNITPSSYTGFFNTFGLIFNPLRAVPRESTTPALYVQAPVLALIWGLLAAPLVWRERRLRAGVATALIVLAGLLVVIMSSGAYEALPTLFRQIQFAYRLQTYVALACAGLVLVGALALTRRAQGGRATRLDRPLALGLGLAVAFGVGLSAWQLWVPNTHKYGESYSHRGDALRGPPTLLPHSWNAGSDYADRSRPVVPTTAEFTFDPTQVKDDRLVASASLPPGLQPFATNIAGGPYLVHVGGGVRILGRTPSQSRCPGGCSEGGNLVLERTTDGSGPVPVELSARLSAPALLGGITTGASAALLLALALAPAARRRRRRSAAPSSPAHTMTPLALRVLPARERVSGILRDGARRLPTPGLIDVAIATLAVLLIASPLLFTSDGFAPDFTNDMWLAGYQQHAIAAHLHPTLFLQTQRSGVFYPLFAFYGGTLFALTGALAALLGGATILAFEAVTLAAIAAAYGGLLWLARQLGVKGVLAHAPAIVFVTSAYYVTDLYGKAAWAEFMAVSALPLLCAASLRLVRGRWRAGPVACLVAASVVFTGSHNITLLWGSTLALVALACYWLLSGRSRELPWRRMLAVAGLIALGGALNGWFLLPAFRYAHDTNISGHVVPWSATSAFNTFGLIFDPLRAVPSGAETPALYVQAPVLALIWGLLAAPLAWRYRRLRAGVATALIVLAGLLVLIMSSSAWSALPTPFQLAQWAHRLQTYVALACAGLVLVGALALTRRAQGGRATRLDRPLALGLGLAVAFGVGLSAWQLWVPNTHISIGNYSSYSNRADALRGPPTVLPHSWNAGSDYGDRSLPVIVTTAEFTFDPTQVKDDRLLASASLFPGLQPFATNIIGPPNLIHVGGGARVVGRTASQSACPGGCWEGGHLVLERTTNGSGPVPVELSARLSAPVLLGRITTGAAAALLLALALSAAVRRRRRSAAHPSA